jgi:uncharacterized integral membrane protein
MRKLLAWIVVAPLAIVVLLFAVANRRWIAVSLDPFSADAPAYSVELPLFLLVFIALIAGVIIGGTAVWFGKLQWRMAAHRAEKEVARLKAEKVEADRRESVDLVPPLLPPH